MRHLEQDIEAHERGDYERIGEAFDALPPLDYCDEDSEQERRRVSLAVEFWDSWIDARNHFWQHYPGVERDDWPVIARQICQGLREGWDSDRMWGNPVLNRPPRPSKTSLWRRLRFFRGKTEDERA